MTNEHSRRGARLTTTWQLIIVCVVAALAVVGCSDSATEDVQTGASEDADTSSSSLSPTSSDAAAMSAPSEWACASPATFSAVAPPPGVEGLPEVRSTATALQYAEGEVGKFAERPTVIDGAHSDERATFFLVDEEGLVVEQVTVKRRDDGRWILDQSTSCRELEVDASGPPTTS